MRWWRWRRWLPGAGRVDEAERVARSVADREWQAEALAAVVESEDTSSNPARAMQLIAVVLTGTAWLDALPALIALVPKSSREDPKRNSNSEERRRWRSSSKIDV